MGKERIQKILSAWGVTSRRKAEELIAAGRVTVNGRPAALGDSADPRKDLLALDGERLEPPGEKVYLALHKPRGYVTTLRDEKNRRCVAELVADLGVRVYPVGRLDRDSEGLLLLTNDGAFANLVAHPGGNVTKTYRVTVRPGIDEEQLAALETGIEIDGRATAPARVRVVTQEKGRVVLEMVLREGRNREIRKMCEALGLEVARLKRTAIGPVRLGMLQPGKYRELTKEELGALKALAEKKGRQSNDHSETHAGPRRGKTAAGRSAGRRGKRPDPHHEGRR